MPAMTFCRQKQQPAAQMCNKAAINKVFMFLYLHPVKFLSRIALP